LNRSRRDPLEQIDLVRIACQASLYAFVRCSWGLVEHGRPFRPTWHTQAICDHLQAVYRGEIRKLLINVPPGMGKSLLTSVFFPAWIWCDDPRFQSIYATHLARLTRRDSMRCRDLITSDWYRDQFVQGGWTIRNDANRLDDFHNTLGGSRLCATTTSATGFRANLVVVDDPQSAEKISSEIEREKAIDFVKRVLPARFHDLNQQRMIVIQQRLHDRDVSGALLEEGGWEHLCLPAEFVSARHCSTSLPWRDPRAQDGDLLFPTLLDTAAVADLKARQQSRYWGMFQQDPIDSRTSLFARGLWRFWRPAGRPEGVRPPGCQGHSESPALAPPGRPPGPWRPAGEDFRGEWDLVALSVDAAFKDREDSDYVVIQVWGCSRNLRYLLDQRRGHYNFSRTRDEILLALADWPECRRVLIEDKANGTAIIETLVRELADARIPITIEPISPHESKLARAEAVRIQIERGDVILPEHAPWLESLLCELERFPRGANDDQVDALTQALNGLIDDPALRLRRLISAASRLALVR